MDTSSQGPYPPDLQDVADLLRAERPEATPLELDRSKLRARQAIARRAAPRRLPARSALASRAVITLLLALGIFTSATGATLAISGMAGSGDDARMAQYENDGVAGERGSDGTDPSDVAGEGGGPQSDVLDAPAIGPAEGTGDGPTLQVASQEEADERQGLPMTGLAALPLILAGMLMLAAGLVLRRRAGRSTT